MRRTSCSRRTSSGPCAANPGYRRFPWRDDMSAVATLQIASSDRPRRVSSRARTDEPEDHRQRPLRPGPELADHPVTARADDVAEDECDDDRIVELPRYGDEVGH